MLVDRKFESEGVMPTPNVMPTVKKTTDYRPRGQRNLIKLPNKADDTSPESRIDEILRRKDQSPEQSSDEDRGRMSSTNRECHLLPGEVRSALPCTRLGARDHAVVREGFVTIKAPQCNMLDVA